MVRRFINWIRGYRKYNFKIVIGSYGHYGLYRRLAYITFYSAAAGLLSRLSSFGLRNITISDKALENHVIYMVLHSSENKEISNDDPIFYSEIGSSYYIVFCQRKFLKFFPNLPDTLYVYKKK